MRTVRRIITEANASVMNLDLYDIENTWFLAQQKWMMPFAIRGMTGLAAEFLHLEDRGFLREGYVADIAVLDRDRIRDLATYEDPKQYSEGTVHVLVNGELAIHDGRATEHSPARRYCVVAKL